MHFHWITKSISLNLLMRMYHIQQLVTNFFWSFLAFILIILLRCGAMIDNDSPRNLISEKHAAIKITNSNKFGCGSPLGLGFIKLFWPSLEIFFIFQNYQIYEVYLSSFLYFLVTYFLYLFIDKRRSLPCGRISNVSSKFPNVFAQHFHVVLTIVYFYCYLLQRIYSTEIFPKCKS